MIGTNNLSSIEARRVNRGRVLSAIRFGSLSSRADVALLTGLTEPAVSRITRELIEANILREESTSAPTSRSPGRPQIKLSIVNESIYVLAFDIAASAQMVSVVDIQGNSIGQSRLNLLDGLEPTVAINHAADEALKLIEKLNISKSKIFGVGVGIAGTVNADTGQVIDAPNISSDWRDLSVGKILTERLGISVRVESRANALLLAEHQLGVAREFQDILLINLSLGIGGAVMVEGKLVRGRRHAAGHIGHMPMPDAKKVCLCSRIGCLDTLASGHSILSKLGRLTQHADSSKHGAFDAQELSMVLQEAEQGNAAAKSAFKEAGQYLGAALQWTTAALQPQLIVLAGIPSRSVDFIEGVNTTYSDPDAAPFVMSQITYETATSELALNAFVYADGFEIVTI
jgi:predicted NBD/HSP70 family sugar kinase